MHSKCVAWYPAFGTASARVGQREAMEWASVRFRFLETVRTAALCYYVSREGWLEVQGQPQLRLAGKAYE